MKARPMLKGFFGLFAAAAILSAGLIPAADLSPAPAMRLKLTGAVYIHSYPPNHSLWLSLRAYYGNAPVQGMKVTLLDRPARESDPGHYLCEIGGFIPIVGSKITIGIQPPGGLAMYTATATIGSLEAFNLPAPDAHYSQLSTEPLAISWRGGNPPYYLSIYTIKSDGGPGDPVYSKEGIAATNLAVPMTVFRVVGRYVISLSSIMEEFRVNRAIDGSSHFFLRQSQRTYIFVQ